MAHPAAERFEAKYIGEPNSGCWLWTGTADKAGYGKFYFGKPGCLAHRASWEIHVGPIPEGLDVLHTCDVPACVNPNHMFLGDDFTNQRDRVAKGRHDGFSFNQDGENNLMAVLSTQDVLAIRAEYRDQRTPQRALARRYNVTQSLVSQIVNRKLWRDL